MIYIYIRTISAKYYQNFRNACEFGGRNKLLHISIGTEDNANIIHNVSGRGARSGLPTAPLTRIKV